MIKNFRTGVTEHYIESESWALGDCRLHSVESALIQGTCADLGGEAEASLSCKPESTLSQGTRRSGLCSKTGNPARPKL